MNQEEPQKGSDLAPAVKRAVVACFLPHGKADPSFNGGVGRKLAAGFGKTTGAGLAISTNVFVAGLAEPDKIFTWALHDYDGKNDQLYGLGGVATVGLLPPLHKDPQVSGAHADSLGRVTVSGYARDAKGVYHGILARQDPKGFYDDTFGEAGLIAGPGQQCGFGLAVTADKSVTVLNPIGTAPAGTFTCSVTATMSGRPALCR
ncbi:MAG: hypothetical protein R3B70_24730 [Polyangiaceae bacterium]